MTILYQSRVKVIDEHEVESTSLVRSNALRMTSSSIQIGTLPPIPFLMDMGLELDGIWTRSSTADVDWSVWLVGFLDLLSSKAFCAAAGESRSRAIAVALCVILQTVWSSTQELA